MIDQEMLKDLMSYSPETGEFIWRVSRGNRRPGSAAGSLHRDSRGYKSINIFIMGRQYKAHRLAWLYVNGEWPVGEIDHINRDATDNRWVNLRNLPHEENSRNRSRSSNNESGVNGIHWSKDKNRWRARVMLNGRNHFIGYFRLEDLDIAAMAVMEFNHDHGFYDGHGRDRPYR